MSGLLIFTTCIASVWLIFVTCFYTYIFGFLSTIFVNYFVLNKDQKIQIGSCSFSLLSGKIVFSHIRFTSLDFAFSVLDGYIVMKWWTNQDPSCSFTFDDALKDSSFLKAIEKQILVFVRGLKLHIYNSLRYEKILARMSVDTDVTMASFDLSPKAARRSAFLSVFFDIVNRAMFSSENCHITIGNEVIDTNLHMLLDKVNMHCMTLVSNERKYFLALNESKGLKVQITNKNERLSLSNIFEPNFQLPRFPPPARLIDSKSNVMLFYMETKIYDRMQENSSEIYSANDGEMVIGASVRLHQHFHMTYGPKSDKQRIILQNFFFPRDSFEDLSDIEDLNALDSNIIANFLRNYKTFKFNLVFECNSNVDIKFKHKEQNSHFRVRFHEASSVSLVYPLHFNTSSDKRKICIQTELVEMSITSSLEMPEFLQAKCANIGIIVEIPKVWNDQWMWEIDLHLNNTFMKFVSPYQDMLIELFYNWFMCDINGNPVSHQDLTTFIPATYRFKLQLSNYEFVTLNNESNFIFKSYSVEDDSKFAFVGSLLKSEFLHNSLVFTSVETHVEVPIYLLPISGYMFIEKSNALRQTHLTLSDQVFKQKNQFWHILEDSFYSCEENGKVCNKSGWIPFLHLSSLKVTMIYHLFESNCREYHRKEITELIDISLVTGSTNLMLYGAFLRQFLFGFIPNYFGSHRNIRIMDSDCQKDIGTTFNEKTSSSSVNYNINEILPNIHSRSESSESEIVTRRSTTTFTLALLDLNVHFPYFCQEPSQNSKLPILTIDKFVLEVASLPTSTDTQILVSPSQITFYTLLPSNQFDVGTINIGSAALRFQSLLSVPDNRESISYAKMLSISAGSIEGFLSIAQLSQISQWFELIVMAWNNYENLIDLCEPFIKLPENLNDCLYENGLIAPHRCTVPYLSSRLVFTSTSFSIAGIRIFLKLDQEFVILTECDFLEYTSCSRHVNSVTSGECLTIENIYLRGLMKVSKSNKFGSAPSENVDHSVCNESYTSHKSQSDWWEVGCMYFPFVCFHLDNFNSYDDTDSVKFHELQRVFLTLHDQLTKRLCFLWNPCITPSQNNDSNTVYRSACCCCPHYFVRGIASSFKNSQIPSFCLFHKNYCILSVSIGKLLLQHNDSFKKQNLLSKRSISSQSRSSQSPSGESSLDMEIHSSHSMNLVSDVPAQERNKGNVSSYVASSESTQNSVESSITPSNSTNWFTPLDSSSPTNGGDREKRKELEESDPSFESCVSSFFTTPSPIDSDIICESEHPEIPCEYVSNEDHLNVDHNEDCEKIDNYPLVIHKIDACSCFYRTKKPYQTSPTGSRKFGTFHHRRHMRSTCRASIIYKYRRMSIPFFSKSRIETSKGRNGTFLADLKQNTMNSVDGNFIFCGVTMMEESTKMYFTSHFLELLNILTFQLNKEISLMHPLSHMNSMHRIKVEKFFEWNLKESFLAKDVSGVFPVKSSSTFIIASEVPSINIYFVELSCSHGSNYKSLPILFNTSVPFTSFAFCHKREADHGRVVSTNSTLTLNSEKIQLTVYSFEKHGFLAPVKGTPHSRVENAEPQGGAEEYCNFRVFSRVPLSQEWSSDELIPLIILSIPKTELLFNSEFRRKYKHDVHCKFEDSSSSIPISDVLHSDSSHAHSDAGDNFDDPEECKGSFFNSTDNSEKSKVSGVLNFQIVNTFVITESYILHQNGQEKFISKLEALIPYYVLFEDVISKLNFTTRNMMILWKNFKIVRLETFKLILKHASKKISLYDRLDDKMMGICEMSRAILRDPSSELMRFLENQIFLLENLNDLRLPEKFTHVPLHHYILPFTLKIIPNHHTTCCNSQEVDDVPCFELLLRSVNLTGLYILNASLINLVVVINHLDISLILSDILKLKGTNSSSKYLHGIVKITSPSISFIKSHSEKHQHISKLYKWDLTVPQIDIISNNDHCDILSRLINMFELILILKIEKLSVLSDSKRENLTKYTVTCFNSAHHENQSEWIEKHINTLYGISLQLVNCRVKFLNVIFDIDLKNMSLSYVDRLSNSYTQNSLSNSQSCMVQNLSRRKTSLMFLFSHLQLQLLSEPNSYLQSLVCVVTRNVSILLNKTEFDLPYSLICIVVSLVIQLQQNQGILIEFLSGFINDACTFLHPIFQHLQTETGRIYRTEQSDSNDKFTNKDSTFSKAFLTGVCPVELYLKEFGIQLRLLPSLSMSYEIRNVPLCLDSRNSFFSWGLKVSEHSLRFNQVIDSNNTVCRLANIKLPASFAHGDLCNTENPSYLNQISYILVESVEQVVCADIVNSFVFLRDYYAKEITDLIELLERHVNFSLSKLNSFKTCKSVFIPQFPITSSRIFTNRIHFTQNGIKICAFTSNGQGAMLKLGKSDLDFTFIIDSGRLLQKGIEDFTINGAAAIDMHLILGLLNDTEFHQNVTFFLLGSGAHSIDHLTIPTNSDFSSQSFVSESFKEIYVHFHSQIKFISEKGTDHARNNATRINFFSPHTIIHPGALEQSLSMYLQFKNALKFWKELFADYPSRISSLLNKMKSEILVPLKPPSPDQSDRDKISSSFEIGSDSNTSSKFIFIMSGLVVCMPLHDNDASSGDNIEDSNKNSPTIKAETPPVESLSEQNASSKKEYVIFYLEKTEVTLNLLNGKLSGDFSGFFLGFNKSTPLDSNATAASFWSWSPNLQDSNIFIWVENGHYKMHSKTKLPVKGHCIWVFSSELQLTTCNITTDTTLITHFSSIYKTLMSKPTHASASVYANFSQNIRPSWDSDSPTVKSHSGFVIMDDSLDLEKRVRSQMILVSQLKQNHETSPEELGYHLKILNDLQNAASHRFWSKIRDKISDHLNGAISPSSHSGDSFIFGESKHPPSDVSQGSNVIHSEKQNTNLTSQNKIDNEELLFEIEFKFVVVSGNLKLLTPLKLTTNRFQHHRQLQSSHGQDLFSFINDMKTSIFLNVHNKISDPPKVRSVRECVQDKQYSDFDVLELPLPSIDLRTIFTNITDHMLPNSDVMDTQRNFLKKSPLFISFVNVDPIKGNIVLRPCIIPFIEEIISSWSDENSQKSHVFGEYHGHRVDGDDGKPSNPDQSWELEENTISLVDVKKIDFVLSAEFKPADLRLSCVPLSRVHCGLQTPSMNVLLCSRTDYLPKLYDFLDSQIDNYNIPDPTLTNTFTATFRFSSFHFTVYHPFDSSATSDVFQYDYFGSQEVAPSPRVSSTSFGISKVHQPASSTLRMISNSSSITHPSASIHVDDICFTLLHHNFQHFENSNSLKCEFHTSVVCKINQVQLTGDSRKVNDIFDAITAWSSPILFFTIIPDPEPKPVMTSSSVGTSRRKSIFKKICFSVRIGEVTANARVGNILGNVSFFCNNPDVAFSVTSDNSGTSDFSFWLENNKTTLVSDAGILGCELASKTPKIHLNVKRYKRSDFLSIFSSLASSRLDIKLLHGGSLISVISLTCPYVDLQILYGPFKSSLEPSNPIVKSTFKMNSKWRGIFMNFCTSSISDIMRISKKISSLLYPDVNSSSKTHPSQMSHRMATYPHQRPSFDKQTQSTAERKQPSHQVFDTSTTSAMILWKNMLDKMFSYIFSAQTPSDSNEDISELPICNCGQSCTSLSCNLLGDGVAVILFHGTNFRTHSWCQFVTRKISLQFNQHIPLTIFQNSFLSRQNSTRVSGRPLELIGIKDPLLLHPVNMMDSLKIKIEPDAEESNDWKWRSNSLTDSLIVRRIERSSNNHPNVKDSVNEWITYCLASSDDSKLINQNYNVVSPSFSLSSTSIQQTPQVASTLLVMRVLELLNFDPDFSDVKIASDGKTDKPSEYPKSDEKKHVRFCHSVFVENNAREYCNNSTLIFVLPAFTLDAENSHKIMFSLQRDGNVSMSEDSENSEKQYCVDVHEVGLSFNTDFFGDIGATTDIHSIFFIHDLIHKYLEDYQKCLKSYDSVYHQQPKNLADSHSNTSISLSSKETVSGETVVEISGTHQPSFDSTESQDTDFQSSSLESNNLNQAPILKPDPNIQKTPSSIRKRLSSATKLISTPNPRRISSIFPVSLPTARRTYFVHSWKMSPKVKLLQWGTGHMESVNVEWILRKFNLNHPELSIPRALQRSLFDLLNEMHFKLSTMIISCSENSSKQNRKKKNHSSSSVLSLHAVESNSDTEQNLLV